jgi:hypothetical protein
LAAIAAVSWAVCALLLTFPITVLRWPAALGLAAIALVAATRLRRRLYGPAIALLTCAAPVFLWWITLTPHQERNWQADMEKTTVGRNLWRYRHDPQFPKRRKALGG